MCQFFSCCTTGNGKLYYFNASHREGIRAGNLCFANGDTVDDADSHSSIAAYFRLDIDRCNKYEFHPLGRVFVVDQLNSNDDSKKANRAIRRLDMQSLCPPRLTLSPVVHPFKLPKRIPTRSDLCLLRRWASVGRLVGHPVGYLVRDSVCDSVRVYVEYSVWTSVRDSLWTYVRDYVGYPVRCPVWDPMWAYTGSFFSLPRADWKYTEHIKCPRGESYPFQPAVTLWKRGLVPSYDGKLWRLHSGPNAEVVYTQKRPFKFKS